MGEEDIQKKEIIAEIQEIKQALEEIKSHRLFYIYNSIGRLYFFFLIRGILVGFGTVIGATVVVSLFVFILSQIEFIPIIGKWVTAILGEIAP